MRKVAGSHIIVSNWRKYNKQSVVLLKSNGLEKNGPLNAATRQSRVPVEIMNCSLKSFNREMKDTNGLTRSIRGIELTFPSESLDGYTIKGTDRINIGGSIIDNTVQGGSEFKIDESSIDIDSPYGVLFTTLECVYE